MKSRESDYNYRLYVQVQGTLDTPSVNLNSRGLICSFVSSAILPSLPLRKAVCSHCLSYVLSSAILVYINISH
eukprot:COSAG02_NODE_4309_length_5526_cov_7.101161_3_plen_73_part_00